MPGVKLLRWRILFGSLLILITLTKVGSQTGPPLDIIILLDQAAAVRDYDPERQLIQSLSQFIKNLPGGTSFGLVTFGSQAWSLYPLNPGEEGRQGLLSLLPQIRFADPEANPAIGLERALSELGKGRLESRKILLLISSGGENGNIGQERMRQIRDELLPTVKPSIIIHGILLGKSPGGEWFQELAAQTGGSYWRALEAAQVESACQSILASLKREEALPPKPHASTPANNTVAAPTSPPALSSKMTYLTLLGIIVLLGAASMIVLIQRKKSILPVHPSNSTLPAARLVDLKNGKVFAITKQDISIGRKPDNDLIIPETTVSGHHAELHFRKGHYYLRDLNSANETKINERKISSEVLLKNGDILRFDMFGFTFVEEAEEDRTIVRPIRSTPK